MPPRPAPRAHPADQAPPHIPPKPAPRWLRPAVAVLAAVYALALFSRPFSDTDSWWQLKTGQYIAANHKLPVPDPFAYTTGRSAPAYPGEARIRYFNLTHEWLAQVGMYAVYSVTGFGGIVLLRALLLCAFSALVGLTARRLRRVLQAWSRGRISRLLKRLRLHGLLRKVRKTYTYHLTGLARRVVTAVLHLKNNVMVPHLAAASAW